MAFPLKELAQRALPAVASGVVGAVGGFLAGRATAQRGQVLAVGRKYIIRQTPDGRIVATSRVPKRRYVPRSRATQMERLLQMALLAKMLR